jgi:hypothetical protein
MDIKDILSVGLTAEDFESMLKGIDAIPERDMLREDIGDIMITLMAATVSKTQADIQVKKMEARKKARGDGADLKGEDLTILKSKLILLKRLLLSNDAIRQANEILTPPVHNI